jgi:hypothetical protein
VKDQFTDEMREAGANLLRELDERNFDARAALWFYLPDKSEWRLLLATPKTRTDGPKKLYKQLQAILLRAHSPLQLSSLTLIDSKDPLVRLLAGAIKTSDKGINGIRFSRNTVNGRFIDDAYIYRVAA